MGKTPAGSSGRIAATGLACLLGWGLFAPADARGATHYWCGDGATIGGDGTWSTTDTTWSASATGGSCYVWDNGAYAGDTADFRGTAGTVTVAEPINVGGIDYRVGGYVITGGTLTFGADATIKVTSVWDGPLTIDSIISMPTYKLTFDCGGRSSLALGGTNDVGSFAVNASWSQGGYLIVNSRDAISSVPIDVPIDLSQGADTGTFRVNINGLTSWPNDFIAGPSSRIQVAGDSSTGVFSGDITGSGTMTFYSGWSTNNATITLARTDPCTGTWTTAYFRMAAYAGDHFMRIAGANCLAGRIVDFNGHGADTYLEVDCTIGGMAGTPHDTSWTRPSGGARTLTIDVADGVYTSTVAKLTQDISVVKLGTGVQRITDIRRAWPNGITGDILVGSGDTDGGYLVLADWVDFNSTSGTATVGSASGTGTGTLVGGSATMAKATTVTAGGTIIGGDLMQATDMLNNILIHAPSDFWTVRVVKDTDPSDDGYIVEFEINGVVDSTDTRFLTGPSLDYTFELFDGDQIKATINSQGIADYDLELYDDFGRLVASDSEPIVREPDIVSVDYFDNRINFSGGLTIDGEYRCYLGAEDTAGGFSQLVQTGAGTFSVGAGATFTLGFANGTNPDSGTAFWEQLQTWAVIDGTSALPGFTFATENLGGPFGAGRFALGYDAVNYDVTLNWLPGAVSVVATVRIATEGSTNGVFTISRHKGTHPVDVLFNLSTNGAVIPGDFTTNPPLVLGNNTLSFAQDQSEIVIDIIPFMDGIDTGTKEVYLQVLLTADYILGTPITDTVTIADDDGPPLAFLLESPANNDDTVSLQPDPVLGWEVSGAATEYWVTVAADASFTTILVDQEVVTTNSYTITTPLQYGIDYWWKVTASNASGPVAATNNDFHFTIAWATPVITIEKTLDAFEKDLVDGVFTLTRVDGDPGDQITLSYNVVGTAVEDVDYVALPLSVTFAPGSLTATINVVPLPDVDSMDQTVTVLLIDAAGGEYNLGAQRNDTLTIYDAEARPRPFNLTSPGDGVTGVSLIPTLEWDVAVGATGYLLEVDTAAGVANPFFSVQTTATSYTPPVFTVQGSATYFWMVTASNVNPPPRKANVEFSFTTKPDLVPPWVKSTIPGDGDADVRVGTNVKIDFSEPMDLTTTELAVSMKDEFDTDWSGVASFSMNGMTLTFNPDVDLTEDVIYTVTVAATAVDLGGNALDGDKNGTGGDDYTFTFTAEPPLAGLAAGDGCSPGAGSLGAWFALVLAVAVAFAARRARRREET